MKVRESTYTFTEKASLAFLKGFVTLLKNISFKNLYKISDFLSFVFYRILRYRHKVVISNLKSTFTAHSKQEIEKIAQGFYTNLSDVLIESIKGFSAKKGELNRRYIFKNLQFLSNTVDAGQSAFILATHMNNWEWWLCAPDVFDKKLVIVYKSMNNRAVDTQVKKYRSHLGVQCVPMQQFGRVLIRNRKIPSIYVLIADQGPLDVKNAHWVEFLNRNTPFIHGGDKLARKTNFPVFYADCERKERGHYEIELKLISKLPKECAKEQITQKYAAFLEASVLKSPENWLWSHKRWKRAN